MLPETKISVSSTLKTSSPPLGILPPHEVVRVPCPPKLLCETFPGGRPPWRFPWSKFPTKSIPTKCPTEVREKCGPPHHETSFTPPPQKPSPPPSCQGSVSHPRCQVKTFQGKGNPPVISQVSTDPYQMPHGSPKAMSATAATH